MIREIVRQETRLWLARDGATEWSREQLLDEVVRSIVRMEPAESVAFALALGGAVTAVLERAGLTTVPAHRIATAAGQPAEKTGRS